MRQAVQSGERFNLIDVKGGDKVDFRRLTDSPFDRSRFCRRYAEEFMGSKLAVSRPEDTILMKLRWAMLSGGSERQFTDALRIFEVQSGNLEMEYLRAWVKPLDIEPLWNRLLKAAQVV